MKAWRPDRLAAGIRDTYIPLTTPDQDRGMQKLRAQPCLILKEGGCYSRGRLFARQSM